MKGHLARSACISAAVFVVPLAGSSETLWHPAPWIGCVVWFAVLATQAPVTLRGMLSNRMDRLSAAAILLAVAAGQLTAVADFRSDAGNPPTTPYLIVGSLLAAAGLALRVWAIRTLGHFFTATVRVQKDHPVRTHGPYSLIRHPSYTGALIVSVATALVLGSWSGAGVAFVCGLAAYLYRIHVEEQALIKQIGDRYAVYRRHTWRLLPFAF